MSQESRKAAVKEEIQAIKNAEAEAFALALGYPAEKSSKQGAVIIVDFKKGTNGAFKTRIRL